MSGHKIYTGRRSACAPRRDAIAACAMLSFAFGSCLALQASAQDSYSASSMWGASTSASSMDSAQTHYLEGNNAGLVNSARGGLLFGPGSSVAISTIGSQSIVSTTVTNSDDADVAIHAEQSTDNTGNQTTDATVANRPDVYVISGQRPAIGGQE